MEFSDEDEQSSGDEQGWWEEDDQWVAPEIQQQGAAEEREINHTALGTTPVPKAAPQSIVAAEPGKKKPPTPSGREPVFPSLQWVSSATAMPRRPDDRSDDDDDDLSSDEEWWGEDDAYINDTPPSSDPPLSNQMQKMELAAPPATSTEDDQSAAVTITAVAEALEDFTTVEVPSSKVEAEASTLAASATTSEDMKAVPYAKADTSPYDEEGGFEDAVRRALGMLGETSGLGLLKDDLDEAPQVALMTTHDELQSTPKEAPQVVERSSLPRPRRRILTGSDDEMEEEPLSSDEDWWGSDDEFLEAQMESPPHVAQGADDVLVWPEPGPGGAESAAIRSWAALGDEPSGEDGCAQWRQSGAAKPPTGDAEGSIWDRQSSAQQAGIAGLSLRQQTPGA